MKTLERIVINDIPIPEPEENQMLIKMASASLCNSDLMSFGIPGRTEPMTLGHEGAGWVQEIHPSAEGKGFKVGDAVGFLYIIGCCFECKGCKVHNMLCVESTAHTQGFTKPGFFAEYAVTDHRSAIVLPSTLDVRISSPLFCAGITGKR